MNPLSVRREFLNSSPLSPTNPYFPSKSFVSLILCLFLLSTACKFPLPVCVPIYRASMSCRVFASSPSFDLVHYSDPPSVSSAASRPISSGCGSRERRRPRPSAGWSSRNPSRSSWTSLAMSRCSSLASCSTCPMFPGWSKRPQGKEISRQHSKKKNQAAPKGASHLVVLTCAAVQIPCRTIVFARMDYAP